MIVRCRLASKWVGFTTSGRSDQEGDIGRVVSISNYADIGVKWQSGGSKYGKAFCRRNHRYPLWRPWPHCLGDPHPSCQYNAIQCWLPLFCLIGLADFVPFSFSSAPLMCEKSGDCWHTEAIHVLWVWFALFRQNWTLFRLIFCHYFAGSGPNRNMYGL